MRKKNELNIKRKRNKDLANKKNDNNLNINIIEENINNEYKSNPLNMHFEKDIINDSFCHIIGNTNNSFIVFKSHDGILYIIYSNKYKSIISYNLIDNKKVNEIKNSHKYEITSFKHYLDKNNERDLILTISSYAKNIKLWNFNNFECLYEFVKVYFYGELKSVCFLNDNNKIYILTSNYSESYDKDNINVYNLKGELEKFICKEPILYFEVFYDKKTNINYIICSIKINPMKLKKMIDVKYIKSYNFNKNAIYCSYEGVDKIQNMRVIYNDNKYILIGGNSIGVIGIWNFDTGKLLKKFNAYSKYKSDNFCSICLWNNNYLFISCFDNKECSKKEKKDNFIKLMDLKNGNIKMIFYGFEEAITTIKKEIIPIYGECLIIQEKSGKIKLFINKD